ncbi:hypothetical protein WJX72_005170 [[Myrmecia] bisecta]|uniref:Phosphate acetyltransferase n=1 Tax=[Myrmecia] bisecta TaxID=41462 RepID=A0AAW1QF22_9CHLO
MLRLLRARPDASTALNCCRGYASSAEQLTWAAGAPRHVELLHEAFGLAEPMSRMVGVRGYEAVQLLASGRQDELMDRIFDAYESYKELHELVILEGVSTGSLGRTTADLDAKIASVLNTPVLMVQDADRDVGEAQMLNAAMIAHQDYLSSKAEVLGLLLNKVPPADQANIESFMRQKLEAAGLPFVGAIPADPLLSSVRLDEMLVALGAKVLYGREDSMDHEVSHIAAASQRVDQLLQALDKLQQDQPSNMRPLVVTSRDRTDLLLCTLSAHFMGGPHIAGLLLTDATEGPGAVAERILQLSLGDVNRMGGVRGVPVMQVDMPLFDATQRIAAIDASILPTSHRKIDHAKQLFHRHVDMTALRQRLAAPGPPRLTPKMFQYRIIQKCLAQPQHIVLPEAMDNRVLVAAEEIRRKHLARVTLLGKPAAVQAEARKLGLNITGIDIVDHLVSPMLPRYIDELVQARKKKGLTAEAARDMLADENVWGTMMVRCGDADGMVSGATHTTANTIRPALQLLRTPDRRLVSSVFFMCLPDKVLVYGDCAVNVDPTAEELAQIAVTSAETAEAFEIEPRVAMLSYSTGASGSGPQVEKVALAMKLAKQMRPDLKIEGPIQYDAAVDPEIAEKKIKGHSEVAGQANVCIFPDLNTGNNTYKAVQQSTGAIAMGPIMQGLARPVNDLSRGCTVTDIVNTVACTSVQAMHLKAILPEPAPPTHAAPAA